MLTDDQLSLLTAAVDGELAPTERDDLRALLDGSAEARAVHARLTDDSGQLKALPVVPPPAGLKARVMARVAEADPPHPVIARPAGRARLRRPRSWAPAAVAASLLFAVAAVSFLFFRLHDAGRETARGPDRNPPAHSPAARAPADPAPRSNPRLAPAADPRTPGDAAAADPPAPLDPPAVAVAPDPRPARTDLLTAPPLPDVRFEQTDVRVPFLRPLDDLGGVEGRRLLAEDLGREAAFRVDLFSSRDPARAVGVFRDAAKAAGLALHVDATTRDRLSKGQATAVVVYTDSLTPAEAAALFGKLAAEDAKISPRVFGAVHATPVTAAQNQAMKDLLGFDPGLLKRPLGGERGEKAADAAKPISAGTADQVVKAVSGKGEKAAVLLTWTPVPARTAPVASAELKQYLAKRGDRKPNAVPLLIVIRASNG